MEDKEIEVKVIGMQEAQAVNPGQSQILGRVEANMVTLVSLISDGGDATLAFHVRPEHSPMMGQRFRLKISEI